MSYVNYTVGQPMPMGPPSLGTTPQLRRDLPPSVKYTQGMTVAQRTEFDACMREKRKKGPLKTADWESCRAAVLAGRTKKAAPKAAAATQPSAGGLLGNWKIWAAGGAAVLAVLWMRR